MAASPSKKVLDQKHLLNLISTIPIGPIVYQHNDNGEEEPIVLGEVVSTPIDSSFFYNNGYSTGRKLVQLKEIVESSVEDDRYELDFELRERTSLDYNFLRDMVTRFGERLV